MAEENKVVAPAPVKTEAKAEVKAVAKTEAAADAKTMNRPMGHGNFRGQGQGHGMSGNKFGGRNGGKFNRGGRRDMEFDEKVVKISRVAKTVKGGKRIRFSALVVIGDKKGKYGYGLGKSGEVPEAIKKAVTAARRNMFHLAIVKGDTIAHPVMGKFGATQVFLKPAPEGTGLVAGGAVRAILELAGRALSSKFILPSKASRLPLSVMARRSKIRSRKLSLKKSLLPTKNKEGGL